MPRNFFIVAAVAALLAVGSVADEIYKRGMGGSGGGSGGLTTYMDASDPVDGSDPCNSGDFWIETTDDELFYCKDGATDDWQEITP